jgi:hypothetical protein
LESLQAQITAQTAEIEALKAPKVAVGAPKTLPFGIYAGAPQFLQPGVAAEFGSAQTQFVVSGDATAGLVETAAKLGKFNYDQVAGQEGVVIPPAGVWVGTSFRPVSDILQ